MPKMVYVQGAASDANLQKNAMAAGLVAGDKKIVFIFPGNTGFHHVNGAPLYSNSVWGAGLAAAADTLAKQGYPTLSLPTSGMTGLDSATEKNLAERAMSDLYRAVGAGYSLALPVRTYASSVKKFFTSPLKNTNNLEPSFWGQNNTQTDPVLADYYIKQLDQLHTFINSNAATQAAFLANAANQVFANAYKQGQLDATTPTVGWLRPVGSQPPAKAPAPVPTSPTTTTTTTTTVATESQEALPKKEYLAILEGLDSVGFSHSVVKKSESEFSESKTEAADLTKSTTQCKALTKKLDIKDTEVYRANKVFHASPDAPEKHREAVILQDNTGVIRAQTKNLLPDEKRQTAIVMARMFLQNNDGSKPIVMSSADKPDEVLACMIHAALLAINPTLTIVNQCVSQETLKTLDPKAPDEFIKTYFPDSEETKDAPDSGTIVPSLTTAKSEHVTMMNQFKKSLNTVKSTGLIDVPPLRI